MDDTQGLAQVMDSSFQREQIEILKRRVAELERWQQHAVVWMAEAEYKLKVVQQWIEHEINTRGYR